MKHYVRGKVLYHKYAGGTGERGRLVAELQRGVYHWNDIAIKLDEANDMSRGIEARMLQLATAATPD